MNITPRRTWLLLIFCVSTLLACSNNDSDSNPSELLSVTDEGVTSIDESALTESLEEYETNSLDQAEVDGLLYMREEEKLAHDVYQSLFDIWNKKIFSNIADSEATHTEAIRVLIERYELVDPVLGNAVGEFSNEKLQQLHDDLLSEGQASLIDALNVGAVIEEVDLIDIQEQVDQVNDNDDIVLVYENLMKGSRNHLRAFVKNLKSNGVVYTPRYLPQSEFDAIIADEIEAGSN